MDNTPVAVGNKVVRYADLTHSQVLRAFQRHLVSTRGMWPLDFRKQRRHVSVAYEHGEWYGIADINDEIDAMANFVAVVVAPGLDNTGAPKPGRLSFEEV
jgi:hypothetical protein